MKGVDWLVITPTTGQSPFFEKTLESLNFLPGRKKHIIVCPQSVLNKMQALAPTSEVISEGSKKCGMYGAINIGFEKALVDYKYLCYINDDDFYLSSISKISDRIIDGNAIFYGNTKIVDKDNNFLYPYPTSCSVKLNKLFLEARIVPFMQCSMIFPKTVMNKLKRFDSGYQYCGDLALILKAMSIGIPFKYINEDIAAFRVHEKQLSASFGHMEMESNKAFNLYLTHKRSNIFNITMKSIFIVINLKSYIIRIAKNKKIFTKDFYI